jgi:hypothetical protein
VILIMIVAWLPIRPLLLLLPLCYAVIISRLPDQVCFEGERLKKKKKKVVRMSRQYSLFSSTSARAKARREKFALAKKSLSEQQGGVHHISNWGEEEQIPEHLPSPTIGPQREGDHPLLIPPSSPLLTTFCRRTGGGGKYPDPGREQGSSRRNNMFWTNRDVSTQANLPKVSAPFLPGIRPV